MSTVPLRVNKLYRYRYPLAYPFALVLVYLLWTSHMFLANRWHIFTDWWPMSLTMVLGSFVAGASAEGGGWRWRSLSSPSCYRFPPAKRAPLA